MKRNFYEFLRTTWQILENGEPKHKLVGLQMVTSLPVLITVQITWEGRRHRGGVKILWARKEQMIH